MSATEQHAEALARIAEQRAPIAALSNVLIVRADLHQICNGYGPLLDLAEAVLRRHAPDDATVGEWCGATIWPCRDAAAALRSLGLDR